MTKKKIIKYNGKLYTFHRDEDGYIHPSGEDYESAEFLGKNKEVVVKHIAKEMKWKLPNNGKSVCELCGAPIKCGIK